MGGKDINRITVQTTVNLPAQKAWEHFTDPESVKHWNMASGDWHCPSAVNELKPGGRFCYKMAAKDGTASFDFEGIFNKVIPGEQLVFQLADGRQVEVLFEETNGITEVTETFEAERVHSLDMQQAGWQAILNSFKQFAENQASHTK